MTANTRKWLLRSAVGLVALLALGVGALLYFGKRFEPYMREQAIAYLEKRFESQVELKQIHVEMPGWDTLRLLSRGRVALISLGGEGLVLRHKGRTDVPPMFVLRKFGATVDLNTIFTAAKSVPVVTLDGMEINVPPKGERPKLSGNQPEEPKQEDDDGKGTGVQIGEVLIHEAKLTILPRDKAKVPLEFALHDIKLESVMAKEGMRYDAFLTNPKPKGQIKSTGTFGPWNGDEPADTPLSGDYLFENADLGVFKGIAGILRSTGEFEGVLSEITAKGEASVPDFRLKMAGNPVPLHTTFEVGVDGTNGNTTLKPVIAKLGSTNFTTSGAVIKHDGDQRRTITLDAHMPAGNMTDVLRLAMKGDPFMSGVLKLDTKIVIPPLSGKVKEKLELDGTFEVTGGKFLRSTIQDKIDGLSRRGQGKPKNQEIDEVVSRMSGDFQLDDQVISFETLAFAVAGAAVNLNGAYDMGGDMLDFRGALSLDAKVSQTMTGWKRWVLKPVDPFFAKNGAGTFLKIKIEGNAKEPKFGLD